jgi:hypothetical protein
MENGKISAITLIQCPPHRLQTPQPLNKLCPPQRSLQTPTTIQHPMRARVKPGRRRGGKALAKTLNPRTLVAAQAIDRPRARSAGRDHRAGMLRAGAATALSVVLVALLCSLASLLARTVPAQHVVSALEDSGLRVPEKRTTPLSGPWPPAQARRCGPPRSTVCRKVCDPATPRAKGRPRLSRPCSRQFLRAFPDQC